MLKKLVHDTRNNWVTMEFNTKYRYNVFDNNLILILVLKDFMNLSVLDLSLVNLALRVFMFIFRSIYLNAIQYKMLRLCSNHILQKRCSNAILDFGKDILEEVFGVVINIMNQQE